MTDHICTTKCFEEHREGIKYHVSIKVARYCESDRRFRSAKKTISPEEALALLQSSPACADCAAFPILHNWGPNDPKQFSFDRLDDTKPHSAGNVRITCLRCNLSKAKDMYGPDMSKLDDYEAVKKEYWALCESRASHQQVMPVLTQLIKLHDEVYGDRKRNGWLGALSHRLTVFQQRGH